jgi:hypothetical protein
MHLSDDGIFGKLVPEPRSMSKKVLFYCAKVWLTSLVLGPVLYFAWSWSDLEGLLNFYGVTIAAILSGFILSLPSALFFWGGVACLSTSRLSAGAQRLLLCGWTALLTFVPFWLLYRWAGHNPDSSLGQWLQLPLCCWIILVIGIYVFRFPAKIAGS